MKVLRKDSYSFFCSCILAAHKPEQAVLQAVERVLQREIQHGAWLNFVKSGNPNGPGITPTWPQYDPERRLTYIFDQSNSVESNPHNRVYEVWKDIQLYQ